MKTLIPWLCVVALLGGAAYLYSGSQKKEAELASLRAASSEVEQLRAEVTQLKSAQVSQEEVAKLRKDNEDLLRLRNEVRQLRDEKQQLGKQLQTAKTSVEQQQAQVQKLQTETQQAAAIIQQNQVTTQLNACINNLRQIEGAKQQWALENKKTENDMPTAQQIAVYLKDNAIPTCPAGGKYVINKVADPPTCTIPGHELPK